MDTAASIERESQSDRDVATAYLVDKVEHCERELESIWWQERNDPGRINDMETKRGKDARRYVADSRHFSAALRAVRRGHEETTATYAALAREEQQKQDE